MITYQLMYALEEDEETVHTAFLTADASDFAGLTANALLYIADEALPCGSHPNQGKVRAMSILIPKGEPTDGQQH